MKAFKIYANGEVEFIEIKEGIEALQDAVSGDIDEHFFFCDFTLKVISDVDAEEKGKQENLYLPGLYGDVVFLRGENGVYSSLSAEHVEFLEKVYCSDDEEKPA